MEHDREGLVAPVIETEQAADTQAADYDQAVGYDVLLTPEEIAALLGEKP